MDGVYVQVPEDEYVQMSQTLDVRKKRIELLEQLCRGMYKAMIRGYMEGDIAHYGKRMKDMDLWNEKLFVANDETKEGNNEV